jgi:hypothetical protein
VSFRSLTLEWAATILINELLTMPKLFIQTMCFMLDTCFPFGSLKFWYVLGKRYLHDHDQPIKTLGVEFINVPAHSISHVSQHIPEGNKYIPCNSMGRALLEACAWCPEDLSQALFPFAYLGLSPFTETKHSCECDDRLNAMSPLSKSLNVRWFGEHITQPISLV